MQKYFLNLKKTMPSMSPIDKKWPARPYLFMEGANTELRRIFYLWRVSCLATLDTSVPKWNPIPDIYILYIEKVRRFHH